MRLLLRWIKNVLELHERVSPDDKQNETRAANLVDALPPFG
jgi:hypothetical protein